MIKKISLSLSFLIVTSCVWKSDIVEIEDHALIPKEAAITYINNVAIGSEDAGVARCRATESSFNGNQKLRYGDFEYYIRGYDSIGYDVTIWEGRDCVFCLSERCDIGYDYSWETVNKIAAALESLGGTNQFD